MRHHWAAATAVIATLSAALPAEACRMRVETNLDDIRFADLVVVGRIANYRIVLDQEIRRQRREQLARPNLPPSIRRMYETQTGFLSDYASFDILVDRVLAGRAMRRLTVTWDNSTFAEPETMAPGPYLIALRNPGSRLPPLRGPSAFVLPAPPGSLTLLQAPCAGAFIFDINSASARWIGTILASPTPRPVSR